MNQTPANGIGAQPEPQDSDFASDEAIENAALAGAAAVQRLVAERNNLRNRVAAQQRELASMRAFNEELRRRLFAVHQRYVEVAKRVVGQLEQFDGTIRQVLQEGPNGAGSSREKIPMEAATLAQRLAATGAPAASADDEEILEPEPES
jgi:hypothetical protein